MTTEAEKHDYFGRFLTRIAAVILTAMAITSVADNAKAASIDVDLELQLLVDVSGSVDPSEFALQRDGYVNAFKSAAVQNAITDTSDGRLGKIAAQFIYWSSASSQSVAVDWTEIGTSSEANAFADAIAAASRPFTGGTAPGSAINFGFNLFSDNGFEGIAKVMDVSGDGPRNGGANTADARDAALSGGIDRINGLPIGASRSVEDFYRDNIVGGTNSFLITASDFNDFQSAVARKLQAEISGEDPTSPIPLPAAGWMLIGALGGLVALRRRKA